MFGLDQNELVMRVALYYSNENFIAYKKTFKKKKKNPYGADI